MCKVAEEVQDWNGIHICNLLLRLCHAETALARLTVAMRQLVPLPSFAPLMHDNSW